MSYRSWLTLSLGLLLALLLAVGMLNFVIDPYQLYRQARFYKPYYASERNFNAGLARHYDYDTIIIGSSMTENFRPSYIDPVLGVKSIKLSISAGTAYERRITMQTALRTGKVKHVIYGLDLFSFRGEPEKLFYGARSFPFWLYDESWLNDVRYLLNLDVLLTEAARIIRSNFFGHNPRKLDKDLAKAWGKDFEFSKDIVLKSWRDRTYFAPCTKDRDQCTLALMQESFRQNLEAVVAKHPEVQFHIFYPPYSILSWAHFRQIGMLEEFLAFKAFIAETLARYSNVRLYDFQPERGITFQLDNYKDLFHYGPHINDRMIDAMAAKKYVVRPGSQKELKTLWQHAVEAESIYPN